MLKDGVVAEQGTHDELLTLNGVYAELHRIQFDAPAAHPATPHRDRDPTYPNLVRHSDHVPSLIVLPDDSAKPIVDAINAAKRSLRIRMFLFTDPTMLQTVLAAKKRGVKVRVMLNPARRDGTSDNGETRDVLVAAKIEVRDSNPAFDLTHQKSMVVDETTAFVESLNWETRDLTETRDYAVVTAHDHEVGEMIACFEADWERKKFTPHGDVAAHLVPEQRPRAHRRTSSNRRSTRSGCRTSATRTRSSSSGWCAPRGAA